ncbi:uncharacterized protein LOC110653264 [Hevea brasiliensis]|uniref:uncharacterized protein LOC110653264 n=1 Tax=Hevea brasiliensis TaxID=3981 RepID=UPI0025E35096|nr:uncharacterized protein LOC110653264 [Hevea brasiliensis]
MEEDAQSGVQTNGNLTGDPYILQNSDHPGMTLVSFPLTGLNYLSWSRSTVIALRAKDKRGFINGKYPKPDVDSPTFEKWQRVDSMVLAGLLNSIAKDIVDEFLSSNSVSYGLNDSHEHVHNQILFQDPLPNVNKTYSMINRVEKNCEVASTGINHSRGAKNVMVERKINSVIIVKHKDIHVIRVLSFMVTQIASITAEPNANISSIIQQELAEYMKGKMIMDSSTVANFSNFAGNEPTKCLLSGNGKSFGTWIVDTRADRLTNRIIVIGKEQAGLYKLDHCSFTYESLVPDSNNECNKVKSVTTPCPAWHERLGHVSHSTLLKVSSIEVSGSINQPCEIFPLSKQQHLSFSPSTISSYSIFELIHVDLWGPYQVLSISRAKYILTIVDDFSRTTWTYLLHDKVQVFLTLLCF